MSDRLTRQDFLRRAAVGGSLLAFPGLLAARGSAATKAPAAAAAAPGTLPKTIVFSNWPLYIDVNNKKKTHPSLHQFEAQYHVNVKYIEDINDNDSFFGKIEGPLSQGQSVGRDLDRHDRQLGPAAADDPARLAREARQVGDPEHQEPPAGAAASELGPQPRVQPAVAVRHDGHRLRPEEGRRRRSTRSKELFTNPKFKGKVTLLTEMADTMGLVMLANGDDPSHVTDASWDRAVATDQEGREVGPDPPVHGQRLRAAAGEGRHLGLLRVVGRHGAAPGRPPGPQVDDAEDGRDDLDGQHAHPEGRQRLRGLGAHELVLQAEDRRRGRGLRQLHLPGRWGRRRCSRRRIPRSRRTRSSSRRGACSRRRTCSTGRRSTTRSTSRTSST